MRASRSVLGVARGRVCGADGGAVALFGDAAVKAANPGKRAGNFRKPDERTHAGNLAREGNGCIGTAGVSAVGQKETHFVEQFFFRKTEKRADARVLERRDVEAVFAERGRN